ncbi:MAG: hypothetical protein SVK08_03310, partial [Halobacteriota archaeon]|nr:hypothetical protein [Halobacteriota archaeon]
MKRISILLFLAFVVSLSTIGTVSAGQLNITTPDYGIAGDVITVSVNSADVIEGIDVYFVLNGGTPVHGQTDGEGEVSYMVQLPGRLKITAKYSLELVSKE